MEFTPDMAFAAAQIIAVLLVATIIDPTTRHAMRQKKGTTGRWRKITGAWISYLAKLIAVFVLLLDMQLVLFDSVREGNAGATIAIANYVAVAGQALTVVTAVLANMGATRTDEVSESSTTNELSAS